MLMVRKFPTLKDHNFISFKINVLKLFFKLARTLH